MKREYLNLLLVEDSIEDVQLTKLALKKSEVKVRLSVANNGEECLEHLNSCKREGNPLPDLILLDLNMPKKGGKEVLKVVKSDKELIHIPVIVLTTSQAKSDIDESYSIHANSYINKPIDFMDFVKLVKSIEKFWFKIVRLPGFCF